MHINRILVPFFVLCLTLNSALVYNQIIVHGSPGTEIHTVNPLTGGNSFNFTTSTKSVGDAFIINFTVVDVADLNTWQVGLEWNSSLLNFVNVTFPSDNVFAGKTTINPPPEVSPGSVWCGQTIFPKGQPTFYGSGTLCQIALNITQGVNHQSPIVSGLLNITNPSTFLLDHQDYDILFTTVDGLYEYSWTPPSYNPTVYLKPSYMQPMNINEVFPLEIWMRDVSPDWSIVGLQFSLTWNTTFIKPALGPNGTYYDRGTFFESYEYYTGGMLYASQIDAHDHSPTPLQEGYNYSMFLVLLMNDLPPNPPYHAPYPNGEGKVLTVYFEAVYDTVFPFVDYTQIEFIGEDTFAADQFSLTVQVSAQNCEYSAPVKVVVTEHNLAVTELVASMYAIGQGGNVDINATIVNIGSSNENFNITLYANQSTIAMQQNVALEIGASTTLTFQWNTTGYGVGNYVLWTYIEPVPDETHIDDNNLTMTGYVFVTFLGDVTGEAQIPDGKVDMRDIGALCNNFGRTPAHPLWNPIMDLNGDNRVDMRDIGIACGNFGKHYP